VSFLTVLPLAFVMIAGPQIISAGTMIAFWGTSLLEQAASPSSQGTVKTLIDWLVVVLFLFLKVRTYLRRKTTEEPRWIG